MKSFMFIAFRSRLRVTILVGVLLAATWHANCQVADFSGAQIIEQAIAKSSGATGWGSIKDFRATGTFSLFSTGSVIESGRADVIGKGFREFKLTAHLGPETRAWLVRNGAGALRVGEAPAENIGPHNVTALELMTLPMLKAQVLVAESPQTVALVGTEAIDGNQAYRIRISRQATNREQERVFGGPLLHIDLLLDVQTLRVLAIEDTIYPNNHTRDAFQHRVSYSDYRIVNGIEVPFKVAEEVSDQLTWELQLDAFVVNNGIDDTEFTLN